MCSGLTLPEIQMQMCLPLAEECIAQGLATQKHRLLLHRPQSRPLHRSAHSSRWLVARAVSTPGRPCCWWSTPLTTKLVAGHWLSGGWPAQCCCRRRGEILVFSSSVPQTDSPLIVVARRGQFPVISSYLPQADSLFGAGRTTIFGECSALLYFTDELEIRISSSRNFKLAKQQYLSRVQSHAHCTLLLNCMLASCIY